MAEKQRGDFRTLHHKQNPEYISFCKSFTQLYGHKSP
jgi:hypothetical protein